MREAKEKCRGKWYIPAGHVEPGETIEVIFLDLDGPVIFCQNIFCQLD